MGFMSKDKLVLCIMFIILSIIFLYSSLSHALQPNVDFSIYGPYSYDPDHVIIDILIDDETFKIKIDKDRLNDIEYIYGYVNSAMDIHERNKR
jgi:hypothetical protein